MRPALKLTFSEIWDPLAFLGLRSQLISAKELQNYSNEIRCVS